MPKVLGDNTTSNSRYHGRGIFTDKCRILSIEDLSNYVKKPGAEIKTIGEKGFRPELCLKLRVDTGIEMDMYVMGNFNWKIDPISGKKIEYLGWKPKGNAVQNLLVKILGSNAIINDDDTIAQSTLNQLIGKEFFRLRYCQTRDKMYEGKPSTQTWNIFAPVYEGADDDLVSEFNKVSTAFSKYDPLLWDEYQEEQKAKAAYFDPSKISDDEGIF